MDSVEVTIRQVANCPCEKHHLNLVLQERDGRRRLRIGVESEAGRAIHNEIHGISTLYGDVAEIAMSAITSAGAQAESLVLSKEDGTLRATLHLKTPDGGRTVVNVEPCAALIFATRLKISLRVAGVASGPETRVPEVYHDLIESLDLDGLG